VEQIGKFIAQSPGPGHDLGAGGSVATTAWQQSLFQALDILDQRRDLRVAAESRCSGVKTSALVKQSCDHCTRASVTAHANPWELPQILAKWGCSTSDEKLLEIPERFQEPLRLPRDGVGLCRNCRKLKQLHQNSLKKC
jgi:hypothetical protein